MRPLTDHDVVIRIDGAFDLDAARDLLETETALPGGAGLVVDLSEAYRVDDFAVAFLATALTGTRPFRLRGLPGHHERLLRYMGLSSRADSSRVAASGKERRGVLLPGC